MSTPVHLPSLRVVTFTVLPLVYHAVLQVTNGRVRMQASQL